jgi:two-component system, OmpR family, torCAD operon response regulator TorR
MIDGSSAKQASDRRERLIVVEDDPVTRAMICGYFADHCFAVEEAATGAECRHALRRGKADLLFVDIQLPDCDGLDLAKEVRARSDAGIIFVTRRDSEIDRILGLELAATITSRSPSICVISWQGPARCCGARRSTGRRRANAPS